MSKSNFEDAALALFYSEQGQKYQAEGNYEAAIKAYGESLRLFPFKENVGTYYNLGGCYYDLKDYRRAIDYYTQTLQINPDNLDAYYNRGTSRSRLDDYQGAIEDYTKVISRNPNDANAYELRGGCYFKISNIQQAMSDFQIAAELYLSQGNLVRYQRIMALPGMGSPSKISSNSSSSSSDKSCFIATAAYSTPHHPDLDIFRNFRDEKLLTNTLGKRLVNLYYQISPSIAKYVEKQPAIKNFLRQQLGRLAAWMRT